MVEQMYNDQIIAEYLLGSLSEEEIERFDEMSFIDDEFAERLRAVENDLVDAYAKGELSGNKLERFKSFYLASPVRREKVRFAEAFQSAASASVVVDDKNRQRAFPARSDKKSSLWRRFFEIPSLQWGLVAAALMLLRQDGGNVLLVRPVVDHLVAVDTPRDAAKDAATRHAVVSSSAPPR